MTCNLSTKALEYSFQTPNRLCFVMEYVSGGELFYHMTKSKGFGEERSRFYGAEITVAIGFLHENNIVYRDLKLENLLLDSDGHVKLTDFGLCKENVGYGSTTATFCGTPEYLAPEVLCESDYSRAVDWWGLGIVLYEMICGKLPFFHRDQDELFRAILDSDVKFPKNMSDNAKALLTGLLQKDPEVRLGGSKRDVEEVKSHAFFGGINWLDLADKKIKPPFRPVIKGEDDVSNFDPEFTSEDPNKESDGEDEEIDFSGI
jgi:RAC serine/threonine-protein kinase